MKAKHLATGELPALTNLMQQLGVQAYFKGEVSIAGVDPVLRSPHRLGEAISTVLALDGVAAAAIWHYRTGQANNLSLNMHDTIHHLHPTHFLWQSGLPLNLGAENVATNGLFKCQDGRFIMIEAGPPYPKLQTGYLNFFQCGNNREALANAIGEWPAHALEDALAAAGLPGCIAYTHEEWLQHPQGKILAATPFIEIEKIASGEPAPFLPNPQAALSGIKVLDFTHVLAGPRSTRTLAEFGARVLHISSPYHADTFIQNLLVNYGKRSAYLDVVEPKAQEKLRKLLTEADVFAQSYRPGVVEKYQASAQEAAALSKKGIVYLSINCYGHSGSWHNRPGFDQNAQTATGVAIAEGSQAAPRFTPVFYLNDLIAGYAAAAGMMAALLRRAIEGGSYHVKISLARSAMWVQDLGYVAPDIYNSAPEKDLYPAKLITDKTPFGPLTFLAPAVEFSNMPKVTLKPVVPYGADVPSWNVKKSRERIILSEKI